MRRGQLLSFDALVSVVIVIFILSAVSASADNLSSGITSMLNWYERTNLANNMLDVLVNSPGEPDDWESNPTDITVIGLESTVQNGVDYNKLHALVRYLESNDSRIVQVLDKMALGNNLEIAFAFSNSSLSASFGSTLQQSLSYSGYIYNGDCSITGSRDVVFNTTTIVNCTTGFSRKGSGDLTASEALCIISGFDYTGSGDVTIGTYFAINGTFDESGSGDVVVGDDLYVFGWWDRTGSGSINIGGNVYLFEYVDFSGSDSVSINGSLYIFNATLPAIGITGSNDITINGWIYIEYDGIWYAVRGYVSRSSSDLIWYRWNGTDWALDENGLPGSYTATGSGSVSINGDSPRGVPPDSFPVPPCFLTSGQTSVVLSNLNITMKINYPSLIGQLASQKTFAIINGSLITDSKVIKASKSQAQWISSAVKIFPIATKIYQESYTLNSSLLPKELYSGMIDQYVDNSILVSIPDSEEVGNITLISMFVTPQYSGYAVILLARTQNGWAYGVNMTKVYPNFKVSGAPSDCTVKFEDNNALVSLNCLVPPATLDNSVTFAIWAYSLEGFPSVTIEDLGNLDVYLKPIKQMGVIRLWLWPRR